MFLGFHVMPFDYFFKTFLYAHNSVTVTLPKISVDFTVKKLAASCQSILCFFFFFVLFLLFFLQAPENIFRNQVQYGGKKTCIAFAHIALNPKRYFRVLSVNITLPFLDF